MDRLDPEQLQAEAIRRLSQQSEGLDPSTIQIISQEGEELDPSTIQMLSQQGGGLDPSMIQMFVSSPNGGGDMNETRSVHTTYSETRSVVHSETRSVIRSESRSELHGSGSQSELRLHSSGSHSMLRTGSQSALRNESFSADSLSELHASNSSSQLRESGSQSALRSGSVTAFQSSGSLAAVNESDDHAAADAQLALQAANAHALLQGSESVSEFRDARQGSEDATLATKSSTFALSGGNASDADIISNSAARQGSTSVSVSARPDSQDASTTLHTANSAYFDADSSAGRHGSTSMSVSARPDSQDASTTLHTANSAYFDTANNAGVAAAAGAAAITASQPQERAEPAHEYRSVVKSDANSVPSEKPNSDADGVTLNSKSSVVHVNDGINVARAEHDFQELSRELSRLSRSQSKKHKAGATDIEKVASVSEESDQEPFDLEAVLRGRRGEEEEAGIKSKKVGVIWDGLTVRGIGGVKNYVKTFPQAFVSFFNVYETAKNIIGVGKKGREFDILKDFRGVAKPGEMVLVLGRPGSGCTSFLKVIANQRFGYTDVSGEVLYGPFDAATFEKRYRGEAVYNQEDDIHHPTLTVGQTLDFALETKVPGARPAGLSRQDFKQRVIDMLLKMFNIEHTKNTIVGNPFVRGVSGGERKRVSIAEMMITNACICSWDNSTRGLDASTALDYAKSLRILTDIHQVTTFVSLYQASESIYKVFDKVMVIDSGRCVYYGAANEARAYFEGLGFLEKPRQTTPDYLTGCTDPFEREFKPGHSADNVPSTPEGLAEAYKKSDIAARMDRDMEEYRGVINQEKQTWDDFQTAVTQSKRHASKRSVYTIPFYLQVWALMRRQFFLKWQDKFSLTVSWLTSIVVAIILGTVWLKLPTTSAGAFTRGGLLFISLLFNAFEAFSELASTMTGRPIINKHRAYTFHRPSALWIAQIMVDTVFASAKILVFSIMVYFMCGLVLDAGAFFTFVLIIISGYLSMTLFFRTVGCLCPDFDVAIRLAATIITFFVLTSGYLIQWQSEQVWLRWIFYINALGLGFSSLMMNEFKRLTLTCASDSLVPAGGDYNDIAHQSCTLAGSTPGTNQISGSAYIEQGFAYNPDDLWRNWGIMVVLIVGFLGTNALLGEHIKWGAGGKTVTFFAKENSETKGLNEELQRKKDKRNRKEETVEAGDGLKITSKSVLTWEDLCYDVPHPSGQGQLRLLNNIFGYVQPGKLTALMGASGAGKTTLLDVLAARKNIGVINGEKLVDGKPPGIAFQRGTAYAEQLDVHEPSQTVREALRFSADLRQPYDVPQSEKYAYVEEVISLLEMEDIADAIIGDPENGLAVEQRKRVTIGVELAAKPELLLFLDEPTSGLDSQSAFNIVRFLRKLAAAGQAILCTIHQPNSALFESFDRLLLLQRGGQCVYFGDIGKDAHVLLEYFHKNGADCPADLNPAEWMLDAIGAGQTPRIGNKDWGDIWKDSDEFAKVKENIIRMKRERIEEVGSAPEVEQKEYATPLWYQIKRVNARQQLSYWRTPNYGFTRFFNHVVIALFTGLAFLQLDDSRASLQYRVFVIFQVTVLPALILAQIEPKYAISRMISFREQSSKAYKTFPFALSMVIAEMPYSVLCAVGFFLPLYYIPGFQSESSRAGYQFFIILITEVFSVTLGQLIAAITPDPFISAHINPFVIIVFALFCGVTIPKPQIPKFWRAWLYQLDPFTRLIGGMLVTELHGRSVECTSVELNRFNAPANQTCGDYMSGYFAAGGPGYIVNNQTSECEYCAYKVGDEFYQPLGYKFSNRWRDLGIFAAFIGSNLILLFTAARFLNFNRR
ncbi:ABC transporter G family member 11 [Lasiodiplodia theobromae]|uniref:ABC transporter G family member 11 n=1 Tax=Lasiodiplodia theobromae TaxID=45133 RepID=A0A5N5DGL2_9PEZI|nr:ABC transporter G family member 11 [Lasiodiplodia theobromae]